MNKKTFKNKSSSRRSLSPKVVIGDLVRDIRLFLFRPILRTATLCNDEAGVKAFTLIELLVVVLIIGILAAIALPQYEKVVWKSKVLEKRIAAQKLLHAFELYDLTGGEYPHEQLHGAQTKNFFNTLGIDFPDKLYNSLVIHCTIPRGETKPYPHYTYFGVKNPDFGVCFYMTPDVSISKRKKILCVSSTEYGEEICKSICGTAPVSSWSCGPSTKGCLM